MNPLGHTLVIGGVNPLGDNLVIGGVNPLGDNLIVLLMLALGGALAVGNFMALIRPREEAGEDELERPPLARSIAMIVIGLVATIWALVSLVAG